jgi:DNA-directed RNA polymerase specialized sigma24 family protein
MMTRRPSDLPVRAGFPLLPFLRTEWIISSDDFDVFLAWLGPNREAAGKKYEDIRRRLIKMFASRGCFCPEDLADETINRVISKVRNIREDYHGDPGLYFGGVARNVFHEYARRRFPESAHPPPDAPESREGELACLEECLDTLPATRRDVILRYYEGEKRARIQNRSVMARELGTDLNALRIKAHRIRVTLQQCVGDCLARRAN